MTVINGESVAPSPDECVWYVCLTVQGRKQNRRGPMYYNDAMQTVRDWMVQPMTHGFVTASPPAEYPDPSARRRPAPFYALDDDSPILNNHVERAVPAGAGGNITLTWNVTAANTTVEAPPPPNPDPVVAAFGDDMRRLRERWDILLAPPPAPPPPDPPAAIAAEIDRMRRYWDLLNPPVSIPATTPPTTTIDEDEDE